MDGRFCRALLLIVAVFSATIVCAQTAQENPPAPAAQLPVVTPPSSPSGTIDATKLGVSFDRVRMELAHPSSKSTGLKLEETIEVVGKAPKLELWNPKTVDLKSAAVPFGAPTQKDIMKLIVPKEFQTYPMDLNALLQWLMEHLNKKTQE